MNLEDIRHALADRYEIEAEAGSGGMATVFRARDLKHERVVAVKVLRPELAAALGSDRFLREIHIAAALQHPHILPLYDSGDAGDFLYYVMPFVKGETLRDRLAREQLSVMDAVRILRDVCDALAHAHAEGVVHRDIKPDNVLLSGRHALVADFGVAKAVHKAADETQMTTVGVALGTPVYMAPEQAMGDPEIDHRVDIYATGVLAYEMLAGEPPFSGKNPQQILSAHVIEKPTPIEEKRSGVPPALNDLIMKCLEKQADDRWQSVDEMLPELELLATSSGGMTPTSTRPLKATSSRSSPASLGSRASVKAAFAGIVIVVLAGTGWLFKGAFGTNAQGVSSIERLAVLPLKNLSSDTTQNGFVDAMHNMVTAELTLLGEFAVTPTSAILAYKHTNKTISDIARELNVDAVMDGAVLPGKKRVRVTVWMVDASSEKRIWTRNYDQELNDPSETQAFVAQAIASAIKTEFEK